MASLTFDSFWYDVSSGNIKATDTFYALLVTSSYTPDKATHTKRSHVTNEVANGNGYATGGAAVAVTLALDTVLHRITWTWGDVSWAASTISAAACVIYKSRGGASSADELVCYVDDGSTISDTAGTWTQHFTAPTQIQN